MATRRNALALYDAQKRNFETSQKTGIEAWEMLPEGYEEDAAELLEGNVSSAELRRRGHPFARARKLPRYNPKGKARVQQRRRPKKGVGVTPLLPINKQSHRLRDALDRKRISQSDALAAQSVGFDRSEAGDSLYVLSPTGTQTMVVRGFWAELKKRDRIRALAFRDVFVRTQRNAMTK